MGHFSIVPKIVIQIDLCATKFGKINVWVQCCYTLKFVTTICGTLWLRTVFKHDHKLQFRTFFKCKFPTKISDLNLGHCYYFLCFSSHRNSKSYTARWKKNNLGQKKKVLQLPTSSSSSGDSVFQALNGCFSLQHCGIMLHFRRKHI